MASVKISQLRKFNPDEIADGNELLIPTSKGDIETGSINVKELVDDVIANSAHEQEQQQKIADIENIDIWDKESFY